MIDGSVRLTNWEILSPVVPVTCPILGPDKYERLSPTFLSSCPHSSTYYSDEGLKVFNHFCDNNTTNRFSKYFRNKFVADDRLVDFDSIKYLRCDIGVLFESIGRDLLFKIKKCL